MVKTCVFTTVLTAICLCGVSCKAPPTDNKLFIFRKQCQNECSGPGQKCREIDNGVYKWECLGGAVQQERIRQRPPKIPAGCHDCDPDKADFICPSYKRKWIVDKKVPNPCPNRALLTTPNGFVVKTSGIPNAGLGVWTTTNISACVIIGPYGGVKVYNKNESTLDYAWKIADANDDTRYLVDAADPDRSNWIRYINSAMAEDEINVDAVQFKGEMYYQVTGPIPAGNDSLLRNDIRKPQNAPEESGTEVLVWYGDAYAEWLGLL